MAVDPFLQQRQGSCRVAALEFIDRWMGLRNGERKRYTFQQATTLNTKLVLESKLLRLKFVRVIQLTSRSKIRLDSGCLPMFGLFYKIRNVLL